MKIGNLNIENNLLLAPMAGISDYPFRAICRDYGCNLGYSEMISAEGLIRDSEKTKSYLYKDKKESENGNYLAFQIFGDNPISLAQASYIAQESGADIVDVNMGCPVKKVVKTGAGAALLANTKRIEEIVLAIKAKIRVPLTVKIRAGWQDDINVLEVAKVLYNSGADAIIIHPRTQKQGFGGKANWDLIQKVKQNVGIPIIGNGDVSSYSDFIKIKEQTACDGVMIGRGAMGSPWVFKSFAIKADYTPSHSELHALIKRHLSLTTLHYGKEHGVKIIRKHIGWYTKKLCMGKGLREKINSCISHDQAIDAINEFFAGL